MVIGGSAFGHWLGEFEDEAFVLEIYCLVEDVSDQC